MKEHQQSKEQRPTRHKEPRARPANPNDSWSFTMRIKVGAIQSAERNATLIGQSTGTWIQEAMEYVDRLVQADDPSKVPLSNFIKFARIARESDLKGEHTMETPVKVKR